ncbi:hypothetical protein [Sphaerochaeta sp. PS]|uniref:hypothetical protein n=1 Tax=Sphaerochaeta sp. PS TaxID=3076336 RepID=UPI0028A4E230|nr:hypothetical protein [Sphaerochaeta sp. PS]MDT4761069.1 hypothetical protein [Sphaerochaeta sp. PS]
MEHYRQEAVQAEDTPFPRWFLHMTESLPLLLLFSLAVLVFAPVIMVFGALYPLFRHS